MFDFVVSVFSQHLNPTFGNKLDFLSLRCLKKMLFRPDSVVSTVNIGMVKGGNFIF
jgi:hypothetical protein